MAFGTCLPKRLRSRPFAHRRLPSSIRYCSVLPIVSSVALGLETLGNQLTAGREAIMNVF